MSQSLFRKLKEYNGTMLPMHMPGHKRNLALSGEDGYLAALCADCDITEIAGFDNLAEPEELFLELKSRAAKLFRSEEAYPLVNGSTCGILAAIYATVPYGGQVIMARNCHKSVYNGMQLVNARVHYLMPEPEGTAGFLGSISQEAVEEALVKFPDTKLVVITSPTYEGILSDVEEICMAAHAHGVPVLVDSAHGAHLGFGGFLKSAVECGADMVVQSLHKTLPCLTQTAMLHRKGPLVSGERIQTAINMFQTSSPSYLLMASIEGCIRLLEERGNELFENWRKALEAFFCEIKTLRHLKVIATEELSEQCFGKDISKIIVSTVGTNLTGSGLMDVLRREHHIEAEMAAEQYVIAMTGPGDTEESLRCLAEALKKIDRTCTKLQEKKLISPVVPVCAMASGEAMAMPAVQTDITQSVGMVVAEYVWVYPPGIPLLVPGEVISAQMAELLLQKEENGLKIRRGSGKGQKECLKIIRLTNPVTVDYNKNNNEDYT